MSGAAAPPPSWVAAAGLDEISDLKGLRVAVTGATGFVGRRLLTALVAAGAEVTALVRDGHGARVLAGSGAQVARMGQMARALAGQDALVNLAYDMRADGPANLALFDAVIAAARAAGVGRIVHLGSIVTRAGWPDGDVGANVETAAHPAGSYAWAKAEMDARLAEVAAVEGLVAPILQPSLVWGMGSALWTDRYAEALTRGQVVLPRPAGQAALLHVADLVQAIGRALVADLPPGAPQLALSGPGADWAELIGGYAAILGRGGLLRLPQTELMERVGPPAPPQAGPPGVPLAARVSAAGRRILGRQWFEALARGLRGFAGRGRQGQMWPDPHLAALYLASPHIDTGPARAALGWAPRIGLAEGLALEAPLLRARFAGGA